MRLSYAVRLAAIGCGVSSLCACGGGSSAPAPAPTPPAAVAPTPAPQPQAEPEPQPQPEPPAQPPPPPDSLPSQPPAEPPPAPSAPAPVPPPPSPADPPPAPPPPPPPDVPPLASTVIDIDDNHQVGSTYWPNGNTSTGGNGGQVQGVRCGEMVENYHVHFHLSFFLNGEQLAVPRGIGSVEPRPGSHCYYSLHTHEMSGKVHVEAPEERLFTLGQLFAIWGQPLDRNNLAGFTGLPVVVYVTDDNVAVKYDGDLAQIELKSKRHIAFQIGTPIAEIPRYTWWGP